MITIVNDIPPPATQKLHKGRRPVYPFASMDVGSSFALPAHHAAKLGSAAQKWKRRYPGWNYMTETKNSEVRIWRIA